MLINFIRFYGVTIQKIVILTVTGVRRTSDTASKSDDGRLLLVIHNHLSELLAPTLEHRANFSVS
jgi:hypothetical protein